jgi:hypothetical protein
MRIADWRLPLPICFVPMLKESGNPAFGNVFSDGADIGMLVFLYHARRCHPNTSHLYRSLSDGGI